MLLPLVSPITRFVLQCACDEANLPRDPCAWSAADLALEARRQQVGGIAYRWARRNPGHPAAAPLAQELEPLQHAGALQALALVGATRNAVARLADQGIPAIALKGPLLSQRYYGDYATRHASDVDLLVAVDSVRRADIALRGAGFDRVKPRRELPARSFELYLGTQHEFGYVDRTGAISLELHWRYADCPQLPPHSFEQAWQHGETLAVGNTPVRVLGPADTFLQLAIHGAFDGWWRGKWIADLARVRTALPAGELDRLLSRARAAGYGRLVEFAVALSGVGVPGQPWLRDALRYVARRLQMPHPRDLPLAHRLHHRFESARYFAALLDATPLRRAVAYCNLVVPADFDALPLPDVLAPLLPYFARGRRAFARLAP